METAKVSSKGQVTIPIEIRKKLGLQERSHVAFVEQGNLIVLVNSSMLALRQAQSEFSGMQWPQT